jgi:ubiquinol-cytochrome c reductase cytochrome b subunit
VWHKLASWLDDRTGYRSVTALPPRVLPEGPSWTATSGGCLFWMLVVQGLTGLALMSTYSPSVASGWASVYFLQQLPAGSFLRGMHYFGGQALIILAALHIVRLLLAASYRPPRELLWAAAVLLLPLLMTWAVTGNPLPATQKGFAQIDVESNIIASTPVIGPMLRTMLVGGDQVGNLTLTHLYVLHVALLPLVAGLLALVHFQQIHRHRVTAIAAGTAGTTGPLLPYWPHQTVRNLSAFAVVLAVVATLAVRYAAPLDAPADPDLHNVPRPEWYFLFLFELRSYFVGPWEMIATMVIPAAVLVLLLAMPAIDSICSRRASRVVRYGLVAIGLSAWATLTVVPIVRDGRDAEFQAAKVEVAELAARARQLAAQGIPPEGAGLLLRRDPKVQGPKLFTQHCASCHTHIDPGGKGIKGDQPTASNLAGFASRAWIGGLLDPKQITAGHYFGHTAFADGEMVDWVTSTIGDADPDERAELDDKIKQVVIALSAEAQLKSQQGIDKADAQQIAAGTELIKEEIGCTDCHRFHDAGDLGSAPDLTGYGSRQWLIDFVGQPDHERFYRDSNDRMPAFAAHPGDSPNNLLSRQDLALIVDWLRGQW